MSLLLKYLPVLSGIFVSLLEFEFFRIEKSLLKVAASELFKVYNMFVFVFVHETLGIQIYICIYNMFVFVFVFVGG